MAGTLRRSRRFSILGYRSGFLYFVTLRGGARRRARRSRYANFDKPRLRRRLPAQHEVLSICAPDDEEDAGPIPLLTESPARGGRATAYIREGYARPDSTTDPEGLARHFVEMGGSAGDLPILPDARTPEDVSVGKGPARNLLRGSGSGIPQVRPAVSRPLTIGVRTGGKSAVARWVAPRKDLARGLVAQKGVDLVAQKGVDLVAQKGVG